MLSFHNIAALIKDGFSEEQIQKIDAVFSASQAAPAPAKADPKPSPAPAPDPAPAPTDPKPAPADANSPDRPQTQPDPEQQKETQQKQTEESETQKMLREMLGIMQKGFINNMQMVTPAAETAEQILAKVINP